MIYTSVCLYVFILLLNLSLPSLKQFASHHPSAWQEREKNEKAKEKATESDEEDQVEGGEEGEEEDKTEDECLEEGRSQVSQWQVPQEFSLGSLGVSDTAPKAKAKQRAKRAASTESLPEIEDTSTFGEEADTEALSDILADPKLKMISDAIGSVPKCFVALQPSKILDGSIKQAIGHQLKGVWH